MPATFLQLDPDRIVETVDKLNRRINERFPKAGLARVCEQLLQVAREARVRSEEIAKPIWWLHGVSAAIITASLALLLVVRIKISPLNQAIEAGELLQLIDAGFNSAVLIGAALLFVMTLSTRYKRTRCLKAIHELRSLAHIIDMHQLTKDPERNFINPEPDTASSPTRNMTPFQLYRYLDYCSEMLALVSKIAALYVQNFEDSEAVSAVNDLEDLTSGLSRKVWQKIMILDSSLVAEQRAAAVTPPSGTTSDAKP